MDLAIVLSAQTTSKVKNWRKKHFWEFFFSSFLGIYECLNKRTHTTIRTHLSEKTKEKKTKHLMFSYHPQTYTHFWCDYGINMQYPIIFFFLCTSQMSCWYNEQKSSNNLSFVCYCFDALTYSNGRFLICLRLILCKYIFDVQKISFVLPFLIQRCTCVVGHCHHWASQWHSDLHEISNIQRLKQLITYHVA